jgi:hypothetical protein
MANRPQEKTASPVFSHTFSDSAAIIVYPDSRPHNLKIAQLQKGLVLSYNGVEVVGEGAGFGAPVIKYADETYFSGKSALQVTEDGGKITIKKDYFMDLISRDQFRNLKLENIAVRRKIDFVAALYQKNKHVATVIRNLKLSLPILGVQSSFVEAPSKGKVSATYTIDANRINVRISFEELDRRNLKQIFVLNEQGAQFFRRYADSDGLTLVDGEIGVWDTVVADWATIAEQHERLSFSLNAAEGAKLRRGREKANGSLDWVGLDYEVDPKKRVFEYTIELSGEKTVD